MRGEYGRLADKIALLTSLALIEAERIYWQNKFSPFHGYRRIRHRSQKKLRILARRRGG